MSHLFDQLPFEDEPEPTPAGPVRRILSVSELTNEIRGLLEERYFAVWVEGEISNCRLWNSGHLYFTLKDPGAQLRAVMFRTALRTLRFRPEDGLQVVARGRVSVYEPKGEYQIICEHLEPHGRGALQLAFEQLKKRLHDEGLFDAGRKRPLPALPRKIGLVTSLDGAAIRDIVKVLRRRHPNLHVVVSPTRVQGEGAAEDIARALKAIGQVPDVDVIIAGRGGGSIEDLWAFNEEHVVRAIAASPVPVISAVGHEVDVTIADYVADLRAATPSAAAELVVAAKEEVHARVDRLRDRAHASVRHRLQRAGTSLHLLDRRPGLAGWTARLASRGRRVAELTHDLRHAAHTLASRRQRQHHDLRWRLEAHDLRRAFGTFRTRLVTAEGRLRAAGARRHHLGHARLEALAGRLENLSPLAVLARGYAMCWNVDRSAIVRQAEHVRLGDTVHVELEQGELTCEVQDKKG